MSQQFAFEIKAQVKPVAALHVQINTTNDVFEAVTKKENKKNFNDSGNVKVLGDLGGRLH